jgi:PAS domain S-box-containing protein
MGIDITDRLQVKQALHRQTDLLQKMFNSVKAAILVLDAQVPPIILECNRATSEIFGYKKSEMVGRPTTFLHVSDESLRRFQTQLYPAIKKDEYFNLEYQMKRKDGSVFHSDHIVSPLLDDHGKRIGWVSIISDITERKQAEAALRKRQEQYRMLLEASMDAVAITVGTICVYVNKRYAEMLGFSNSSELIGQDFLEFIAPECRELVQDRTLRRERGENVPALYEFMIQRKDGTRVPVETHAVAMQWEEKRATLSFRRDITERKRAEETTSRLAAIVESSNDAIIGRTLDMTITSWNKAAEKIFGYTEEEMIGKTLFIPSPPGYDNSKQTREKIQRGERIEHYETKRIRKDGKIIDVSLTFSPIRARTGEIIGTSQTARDITDRKRLEEELKRHSDHLEELVHERTMMLRLMQPC